MAYQARTRAPLFDRETQAQLERRARELVGLILMGAGVVTAMILGTYSPDDPSFLSATDVPAQNLLGRFGASIASPLFVIAGFGAWGLPILGLAWGLRFCLHNGADRALPRLIFAPIAIALGSIYASTHVPMPGWTHSFGLGGLFGDTVLGALLGILPITATLGLKMLSVILGAASIAMGLYVLGATGEELRAFWRFLLRGSVMAYAKLFNGAALGMGVAAGLAGEIRDRRAAKREAELGALQSLEAVPVAAPTGTMREAADAFAPDETAGRRGLFGRLFGRGGPAEAAETRRPPMRATTPTG